jgi:aspartate kinase
MAFFITLCFMKNKTIVLKFGGAALRDLPHFQRVAEITLQKRSEYAQVLVVVSAMYEMTDMLLGLAKEVAQNPPKREQDMLISVGERISMALLAMVFIEKGIDAISFTGSQSGIITTEDHTDAKIIDVRPKRLVKSLKEGKIVIVAGFQGVSAIGEVTTLGRGGSDTTAVALGVALKAEKVEFYKDVPGIFTADPKMEKGAEHIPNLSYLKALEIVEKSASKVLHPRAIILAKKNGLPLKVLSYEGALKGTLISDESLFGGGWEV